MILYRDGIEGMLFWAKEEEITVQELTTEVQFHKTLTEAIINADDYDTLLEAEKFIKDYETNVDVEIDCETMDCLMYGLSEMTTGLNIATLREGDLLLYGRISQAFSDMYSIFQAEMMGD